MALLDLSDIVCIQCPAFRSLSRSDHPTLCSLPGNIRGHDRTPRPVVIPGNTADGIRDNYQHVLFGLRSGLGGMG